MARMVPSVISPEVKSVAERRIFEWFKNDPATEGWVVLHSLGIANHQTVLYGELDFLVIAPGLGVFALEVKGGRVRRDTGIWHFTNKYNKTSSKRRGPFEQANEAVFSLFNDIKKKCGSRHKLSSLLFGTGVMFPDIVFTVDDMDGEQWQVFDQTDNGNVSGFIKRLAKNTRRKWEEKYGVINPEKIPDTRATKELANLLRGDFDKVISISTQINYAEEALISLTGEQLKCLDQLEDNPRCLIQGAAGTGKTLLAIEEVKRAVSNGERVALFCYNNMLGAWLKRHFESLPAELRPDFAGTFHSFMYRMVNETTDKGIYPATGEIQKFYREELPLLSLEALEINNLFYDRIIVDEAQDLLFEDYLDVMDMMLKGGIDRGRWNMFGDFTRQAIYSDGTTPEVLKECLNSRTSFINYKLKINCRNTKPIGEEIKCLTGFDSSSYLWTKVEGPPVNYYTYQTMEEQRQKIESLLKNLLHEKIEPGKITILSPVKREASVVSLIEGHKIREYKPDLEDSISFSTIQAYKGLENTVIILTDIESYEYEKLLYVGLSRARSALYVFETVNADAERNKMLLRWI
ncbi:DEAD/DEAH box helicase family protein [Propionispora hippei]|uniref:Part of AAA domain-containing protein n=1 Tax=Propionispora hippei DSM 15287 TaxID=1123003 RepID=A0A1M6DY71_9FIRM|nr:DEAD/DEAH box helicase family protein [Propionispora hippei]SHI78214.1 Part of AAA domain-containing protein [Propionispora hippei DSM 15287]